MMFDRVILSSNEDPKYLQFWPIVSMAWKRLFGVPSTLALISNRERDDPFILSLGNFGHVIVIPEINQIPTPNLAKVARHFAASLYEEEVCMINDIDLLPLQDGYVERIMRFRPPGFLLCVGADAYERTLDAGKFPAGYMAAEGRVFHEFINPCELDFENLVQSWVGLRIFDHKEDIASAVHHENPECFSDESLVRALISRWPNARLAKINRGLNVGTDTIDRSAWRIDMEKLKRGEYVEAHLFRPYEEYREQIDPLLEYLFG